MLLIQGPIYNSWRTRL